MSENQSVKSTHTVSSDFVIRKLHSLSGFLPLCFFLAFHLVANAIALAGQALYARFITWFTAIPGLLVWEIVLIFIPLLLHGVFGLYLVVTGRNNPGRYKYFRNWTFFIQRVSGVIIFAFLVWHLWTMKFSGLGSNEMFGAMAANLDNVIGLIFFIISMIAVSFHVSNGLFGFAVNWGILPGMRAQKVFGAFTMVLFIVLAAFWLIVMMAFV